MKFFTYLVVLTVLLVGCGKSDTTTKNSKNKEVKAKMMNNHLEQGIANLKNGDVKKSIEELHLALKQDPKNVQIYLMLGDIYMHVKAYDEAIKYLGVAVQLDPNNGMTFVSVAKCYGLMGNQDEAIKSIKRSIILFKSQNDEKNYQGAAMLLKSLLENSK